MTDYNTIPAVRRSDLWEIRKSPAHYLYAITHEKELTPALAFGIATHKYMLEPGDFWNEFALAPEVDRRTKEGKAAWTDFVNTLGEKAALSASDYATILDMYDALMRNRTAAALIQSGKHEVQIEWTDAETGELCKCRPDVLTEYNGEKYIVDYKTTTSCEDYAFERACRTYGYKLQAGMYTEGVFNDTFERYKFAFVAQEKNPPYASRVYFCDPGFVDEGIDMFYRLIGILHECKANDNWPGYEDKELIGDEGEEKKKKINVT